jgi:CheY-like chemotaxis protein
MKDVMGKPRPPKILVIEDSPADVALLRHALNHQGEPYDLEVLTDGEMALRFVNEHRSGTREPDPCVILLDLHLPKYDGIAVLKAIKRAPVLAHIHVVALSGLASPREEAAILSLGGLYRQKPLMLSQCLELAAEILAICKGSYERLEVAG